MAKRLSRTRLFKINTQGELQTQTAGAGISDSIGSQTRFRNGQEVLSEVTIDLANGTAACTSFATVGPPGQATHKAIGVSSSTGTHQQAQLLLINGTASAADGQGIITSGELICVEAPAGGEDNIGVWYANNASGSGNDMVGAGNELITAEAKILGSEATFSNLDVNLDNKYVYLVSSGSTGATYTAGKFVLRLYGYNVFDDVS